MNKSCATAAALGAFLCLGSAAWAQGTCTFANLADAVASGTYEDEDLLWECSHTFDLSSDNNWGDRLFNIAVRETANPRIVLILSELGAPLGASYVALDIALRHNPHTDIVAVLMALGEESILDTWQIRPEHRYFAPRLTGEEFRPRFPSADANVDCSEFLTPRFMAKTSPGQIRHCQARAHPRARDGSENTALHLAAQYSEDPSAIDAIIAGIPAGGRPAFIDARNREGQTALHVAARHARNADIVTALLAHGADPNALAREDRVGILRQRRGIAPLHRAVRHDDPARAFQITARLLAYGADMEIRTPEEEEEEGGRMALHLAAHGARTDDVLWLLLQAEQSTAGITEGWGEHWLDRRRNDAKQTALHFLTQTSNTPWVFGLALDYGLSPDAQDDDDWYPPDVLCRAWHRCGNHALAS
ncbi:MAG: ankyrin repeat domain-containing protein [Rhodobacteraceae bacterium]|nr:ankyrin repeat domain-containing protein [Paracoccaceae bacterium]